MRKKIIIIGSKGMAGHVMYNYFKALPDFDVIDISRNDDVFASNYKIDVTNTNALKTIFDKEQPTVVVNCIGVLNQDAENNPDKAIFLNTYFPHFLAKEGTCRGFKLVHISTDCVFNGKKGTYTEGDLKDGFGFYAQSKALGEVDYDVHLTIRTSIIGPELKSNGIGLFHWFMQQSGAISGYTKAIWGGVTTFELAKAVHSLLEQQTTGLIHLTNGYKISKFDLLSIIKNAFNANDVDINATEGKHVDKSLISTRQDFTYSVPSYHQMVLEMHDLMQKNKANYQHNYNI